MKISTPMQPDRPKPTFKPLPTFCDSIRHRIEIPPRLLPELVNPGQSLKFERPISLIQFNGPPRAGKDNLLGELQRDPFLAGRLEMIKVTKPLKELVHRMYGMPHAPHDAFEATKDMPMPEFGGLSPRQAYIKVGDKLKAQDQFAVLKLLKPDLDALAASGKTGVATDVGYTWEAEALHELVGHRSLVLQIEREGRSFAGDCREWVRSDVVPTYRVVNRESRTYAYQTAALLRTMIQDDVFASR